MSHKLSEGRVALFAFVSPQIEPCCPLQTACAIMVDIVCTLLYFCLLNIIKSFGATHFYLVFSFWFPDQGFSIFSQSDSQLNVFSPLPPSTAQAISSPVVNRISPHNPGLFILEWENIRRKSINHKVRKYGFIFKKITPLEVPDFSGKRNK